MNAERDFPENRNAKKKKKLIYTYHIQHGCGICNIYLLLYSILYSTIFKMISNFFMLCNILNHQILHTFLCCPEILYSKRTILKDSI